MSDTQTEDPIAQVQSDPQFKALAPHEQRLVFQGLLQSDPDFGKLDAKSQAVVSNRILGQFPDKPAPSTVDASGKSTYLPSEGITPSAGMTKGAAAPIAPTPSSPALLPTKEMGAQNPYRLMSAMQNGKVAPDYTTTYLTKGSQAAALKRTATIQEEQKNAEFNRKAANSVQFEAEHKAGRNDFGAMFSSIGNDINRAINAGVVDPLSGKGFTYINQASPDLFPSTTNQIHNMDSGLAKGFLDKVVPFISPGGIFQIFALARGGHYMPADAHANLMVPFVTDTAREALELHRMGKTPEAVGIILGNAAIFAPDGAKAGLARIQKGFGKAPALTPQEGLETFQDAFPARRTAEAARGGERESGRAGETAAPTDSFAPKPVERPADAPAKADPIEGPFDLSSRAAYDEQRAGALGVRWQSIPGLRLAKKIWGRYYGQAKNPIIVVDPEAPSGTTTHELIHAIQEQLDLNPDAFQPEDIAHLQDLVHQNSTHANQFWKPVEAVRWAMGQYFKRGPEWLKQNAPGIYDTFKSRGLDAFGNMLKPYDVAVREAGEGKPAEAPIARETASTSTIPGGAPGVEMIDPHTVGVERGLQYKQSEITDSENQVSGSLKGTKEYNVPQGGVWTVWRKENGDLAAVNSHHRRELAQRATRFVEPTPEGGYQDVARSVPMRVLDESQGWTKERVRAYGALENIRDGKGTALDATMALRDMGIGPELLGNHQISLTGNMARDVKGLFGLHPETLARVQSGDVPESVAAGIGGVKGLEQETQHGAMDDAANSGLSSYAQGRRIAEHYLEEQQSGGLAKGGDEADLFGGEFKGVTSTIGTRVKIEEAVTRALAREYSGLKKDSGVTLRDGEYVDKEGRKVEAAKYGGRPAEVAERVKLVFDKNEHVRGEVKRLAGEVANGKLSVQEAAGQLTTTVRHFAQQSAKDLVSGQGVGPGEGLQHDSGHGDGGAGGGPGGGLFGGEAEPPVKREAISEGRSPKQESGLSDSGAGEAGTHGSGVRTLSAKPIGQGKANSGFPEVAPKPLGRLESTVIPGAEQFAEQDLKPAIEAVKEAPSRTRNALAALFNPPGIDEAAGKTARILRAEGGKMARETELAHAALADARTYFRKTLISKSPKTGDAVNYNHPAIQAIRAWEAGKSTGNAKLDAIGGAIRDAFDKRVAEVQKFGNLEEVIENYFPHIWKKPNLAGKMYNAILGRRPLQGSRAFLKQRTIETTMLGLEHGLEPVSWNPIELSLLKMREMDRYIMARRAWAQMKEQGIAQFVRFGGKIPDGYAKLNDPIARVLERQPTFKSSGEEGAPQFVQRGEYWMPEGAARVFNNHLSPGLRGNALFDAAHWTGNALNQAQLGLSAFHLMFTSVDAGTSTLALGMKQLAAKGQRVQGLGNIAKATLDPTHLYAPLETFLKGNKLKKGYFDPNLDMTTDLGKMVDALQQAGGRVGMDRVYHNSAADSFWNALESHNYPGAILRAPWAILHAAAYPVMQGAVPRMKLGIFMDLAQHELGKLPKGATLDMQRKVLSNAWDSVDNRMGQVVYDNLFWNRALKDTGMIATRSLGWNLGTIRELGGGVKDLATSPVRLIEAAKGKGTGPTFTNRMAYTMALPMKVALIGALIYYLYNGKGPETLRDYFQPRTGKKDDKGEEERVQVASYVRDIAPNAVAYAHEGAQGVINKSLEQVGAKINPLWSSIREMLNNKDFFDRPIRNEKDPWVQQALQEAAFAGSQFTPFSFRDNPYRKDQPASEKARQFFGITRVPKDRTAAEIARIKAFQTLKEQSTRIGPPAAPAPPRPRP